MGEDGTGAAPLVAAGFEALRRGDANAACEIFSRAVAAESGSAEAWYGLSIAHRTLGAVQAEDSALDRALAADARHLPALIRKGDVHAARNDPRAATSFYRAAIKIGATVPSLSREWRAELERVEAACRQSGRAYERHLVEALEQRGLGGPGSGRFARALELLLGRRRIFLQQPQYFYFPELPQIEFYDSAHFPWVRALEAATGAIREELMGVLESEAGFVPYLKREANRPAFDSKGLLDDPAWSAYHLIQTGTPVAERAARFPRTFEALAALPLCRIHGRTPTVLFSMLRPGAHIPPHHGYLNTRLICHLPLVVPPQCALRVGNETRAWRAGELVIFDDTIEHEAWNRSTERRVVLLFDIWRPELTEQERSLVAAMLEAIDRFGGPRQAWTQ